MHPETDGESDHIE